MKLHPYPSYRKTDLPWLAQIPTHWDVVRLKFLITTPVTDGPHETPSFIPDGVPFLSVDSIQDGELLFENCRFISIEDHSRYKQKALPTKGDILLGKSASTGKIAQVKVDFEFSIWSPLALIRLNQTKTNPTYIEYVLKSPALQTEIDFYCNSNTQKNISMQDIPILNCMLPPLPEQQAIVIYLDRQTAKIDALIAKKGLLLDLLTEQRAAIINRAVTKGLNPDVNLKDSNAAWLGQVPTHWEIKRLGTVAPLLRGHDLTVAQRKEGTIPVYSSSGLAGYHNIAKAKGPGVITGRYGTIGKIYYSEHDFWPMNTSLYVYDFKGNCQRYIFYLLQILSFDAFTGKSAVPGVNRNDLHQLLVCQPPFQEQELIANYIDKQLSKFDNLVIKIETAIERLREYRAALISSVVTGKVMIN